MPEELVRAALGSFAWRRIDAELAELVHDSSSQGVRGALVRGEDSPRLVSFEGAGLTIEVEVAPAATGRRLLGQLVPAGPAEVEVRHQGGAVTVEADQQGRFRAEGVPPGAFSLRCRRAGPRPVPPVETSWVLL